MAAPGRQHLLATFAVAGVAWRLQRFRPRAPAQQVNEDRSEEVLPRADARARLPGLVSAAAHFVGAVRIPGASPVTRTAVLLRGKVGVGRVRGAATHDAQRCRQECRLCRRVQVFHWSRERVRSRVCAVIRRRFPVGASPARRMLQPEATGAVMEVTKWLKPSGKACHELVAARVCRP